MTRRKPEYLSPSALALWKRDSTEYYTRYITPVKLSRSPQTQPMSVGSAFDAYVKSYLHNALFGKGHPETAKYELNALLESQVEAHNLAWAKENGKYVFDCYVKCGALTDLMTDLEKSIDEPRFEFDLKGTVNGFREGVTKHHLGVPLLGKPDLRFVNSKGGHVIVDFKVNGFCANHPKSPMAGYVKVRDAFDTFIHNPSRNTGMHKNCVLGIVDGMGINVGQFLENLDSDWAVQLSTYGWLMGEPVGRQIINAIDQIVASKITAGQPLLRVASHRLRTSENFQFQALADYQTLWSILITEPFHFFRELSFDDSENRCRLIDERTVQLTKGLTADEEWLVAQAKSMF